MFGAAEGPRLDLDPLLPPPCIRIVVCCGAGGVGKTTTAAALALRAAERHGRRTVVLTIDRARRLARAPGLSVLGDTPAQPSCCPPTPPAGWPRRSACPSWTTRRARSRARTGRPAASCTP